MEIDSPIGNLIKVIKQVVKSSAQYEVKLQHNEAATRGALIDPIIKSLGWDTTNPDMVEFEKTFKDTRLDYALYDSAGKVRIIVEAKPLGGKLEDTKVLFSLVSYCLTYGISNLFLTNGIVWQHFTNLQPGNINPFTVDFLKDPLINCASYLINEMDAARFWTVDIKPVETWKPEQVKPAEQVHVLTPIQPKQKKDSLAQQGQSPNSIGSKGFTPLTELKGNLRGKPAPKQLRLPDGTIKQTKHWSDILVESIRFVLQHNPNIPIPLPDKAGKKVMILSFTRPEKKVSTVETTHNGRQVYSYINYESSNIVANAVYILGFLPNEMKKEPASVSF